MTSVSAPAVSRQTAILRGILGCCPNCGRGRLLHRYLKVVDRCRNCGEEYGHLRADDAAPWMTIIITGHLVVPFAWSVERAYEPPMWIGLSLWPLLIAVVALAVLPRCKGVVLALLWSMKAEGSEKR